MKRAFNILAVIVTVSFLLAILTMCAAFDADAQEGFPEPPPEALAAGMAMAEAGDVWRLYTSPRAVLRDFCGQRVGCAEVREGYCLLILELDLPELIEALVVRSLLARCGGWPS